MKQIALFDIERTYIALTDDGGSAPLQVDDTFWEDLSAGRRGEFSRMVSCFHCAEDWSSWEMHPAGEEVVMLLSGAADLHLERDGETRVVRLDRPGAFVLIPRGTWHTASVREPAVMLFITPGEGTQHRPREATPRA